VADGLHIVAVWVAAPWAAAISKKARTAARSGAEKAMCDSRKPSPVIKI
jgi:hypothetical protein